MKILAIDDNRDNLTTLTALLKYALPGCTVATAANGAEGLALAGSEDPDVILLDIIMPGMDGFEVCIRLKADPELRDIPVVFLTAMRTDRETRIKALKVGAEAFLTKPPDETELIAQLRAMTKIRAACRLQRQEKERLAALVLERTRELQRELEERKRVEEALQKTAGHLHALVQTIPDLIWLKDKNGVYLSCNQQFERFYGAKETDIIGKTDYNFVDRKLADFFVAHDRKAMAAEMSTNNEEWVTYADNGNRVLLETIKTPMFDDKGELIGVLGIGRDITERKQAEEALASLNAQNELILNSAAEGILGLDLLGNHTFVNPAAAKMLGYEGKELLGLPSHNTWHHTKTDGSPYPIEECPIDAVHRLGAACHKSDDVFWRKDGTSFPVAYASMPAYEQGKLRGAVVTFVDITERKRAEEDRRLFTEELARSNSDLQQFAYVASHDLQEPLRMVSSYLQLIERRYKDKLDDDTNTFIHYAVDGANRMQALIIGLLEFSRIKTHGQVFAPVEVTAVLQAVCRNLDALIVESGAVVRYGEMPVIQADEAQITRLLQNLLQNALKFRREGIPPVIDIRAETTETGQVFSVHDNGIGIEGQYFERIFTIFQRLHTQEQYPGTGIGLSICKRIVERHGGNIWLESTADVGTTFYFSIPGDLQ